MKALSLRQPWAWMVVHGGKTLENRRWPTRFRGEFLIHAAKGMTRVEYDDAVAFARNVDPGLVVPSQDLLERGGIVGRARLVDVHPPCPLPITWPSLDVIPPCPHPWHMGEQYGFILDRVEPVDFFPLKGMLGFFEVDWPRDAVERLAARVAYLDEKDDLVQTKMVLPTGPLDPVKFYLRKGE